ncbi:SpoIIE family protein phosphatase [Streptomyces sp. PKU-EA00015]|uniref:SpoIIE family protein phosphatase n=1 Tax=Streptomyces sp. PKU-EA00015 TaxID=2748326 RepID=UPI0015A2124B|nr:SpoIIE family protein phosphatase [Streptomyces sp. PKU-EA00015]
MRQRLDGRAQARDHGARNDNIGDPPPAAGPTCLYAAYDPVSGRCAPATAPHPEPVLVRPDSSAVLLDVPAGPPLGVTIRAERTLPDA